MGNLYLWLNIASFSVPFLFSFHPKLKFYKKWKFLLPAIFVMIAIFIPWDIVFTKNGIWGFNEMYITGYKIAGLPLEEWLFFLCIPYACIFTLYALQSVFQNFSFSEKTASVVYILLQTVLIVTLLYFYDRWYTAINFGYAIVFLGLVYNFNRKLLQIFFPSFLVVLLPFFAINGILTGSWIHQEVVWYNNSETLGIKLGTVPIEDIIYTLGMLLTVYSVMEFLGKNWKKI